MRVRVLVVLVSCLLAGVGALVWSSSGRAFNPVVPILECVYRGSSGNLLAVYGYDNQNAQDVTIPVDVVPSNYFSPDPKFRGQPVIFFAGRHDFVFSVQFDAASLANVQNLAMLLGVGITATIGQILLTKAFAAGPPAKVSVIGLTQIGFGVVFGLVSAYSQKDVNGTRQRLSGATHPASAASWCCGCSS